MAKSEKNVHVTEYLNQNIKTLSDLKDVHKNIKETVESLGQQLHEASSSLPTEIDDATQGANDTQTEVTNIQHRKDNLHQQVVEHVRNQQDVCKELEKVTTEIQQYQYYLAYLQLIEEVDKMSSDIQTAMLTDVMSNAVESFQTMTHVYHKHSGSHCKHLLKFIKDTILFWYKILHEKLASDFEETLKSVGWPMIGNTVKSPPVHSSQHYELLEKLFMSLLAIQLPQSVSDKQDELLLPLQLMVLPLRKRFKYHFYGNRKTNNLEKPEWYLGQVLGWIRDHSSFLTKRIQPLLHKSAFKSISAKMEFIRGMVILVTDKMKTDLQDIMNDEHIFSHLIDEAILFDRELQGTHSYPHVLPCCLDVLTAGEAFNGWILIEEKFAKGKMDLMLSSETAWQSQYQGLMEMDEANLPECAESFITLMLTITDRYKSLSNPENQLRFVDLQLELLEEFRIRLVQVMDKHDPLGEQSCAIFNAIYYLTEVLQEWNNSAHFVQLQYFRKQTQPCEDSVADEVSGMLEGIFDSSIFLLDKLTEQMLKNLVHYMYTDIYAHSHLYRKQRWNILPTTKDSLGLSINACEMLLVLKDHLLRVESLLNKPIFTKIWQRLAGQLNKMVVNEIIIPNQFNETGASQIEFDMCRNLFPLFGEYTQKPENYFREIKEACILLTLKTGSACLLKELLCEEKEAVKKQNALHEQQIYKLNPTKALDVLNTRFNLPKTH
ncbi:RAD50-interacting protein 1 [Mytilus galloprovincialis]|uniref:RAD50-interacting protein 1 n=1 Tax=Mytilus galloprovincialis TaxID=29158 RepID=A0A8B6GQ02_MYTGA|nr:RAD50-interacting protein 1 [Mytilus galloprovincialis]